MPYIFDWIFFDDSSELKNLAVYCKTKMRNQMSAFGVYPYHRLARCVRYIIRRGFYGFTPICLAVKAYVNHRQKV